MDKWFFKITLVAIMFIFCGTTSRAQQIVMRNLTIDSVLKAVNADSLKSYVKQMVAFGTRNTLSGGGKSGRGIEPAREWVLQKFKTSLTNNNFSAYIDTITLMPDGKRVNRKILLGNVVGVLKGTDALDKRVFIISGHLDNMRSSVMDSTGDAPGANDDASGVAAVIECARILTHVKNIKATIIFIAFCGEEQGLLGSTYYAKKLKAENVQVEAVLNNDIIGSNNSNMTQIVNNSQLRVFSEGLPVYELDKQAKSIRQLGLENDGKSRQLARYVKEIGERYVDNMEVVMIYRNDRFLRGGDHTPFVENGFAAVRFTEMNENYEHQHQDVRREKNIQYGDLPEFLDYEYLRKNTAVNLASITSLSMAPSPPAEVFIDVSRLTNYTSLEWTKPIYGEASGYYVLVRETTSAVWQKKFYCTDEFLTLPFSKDNYFFAVQSVGATGLESLAKIPVIKR